MPLLCIAVFSPVTFRLLADKILGRVADARLSRKTRHFLMSYLINGCLWAYQQKGTPYAPILQIQQRLRSIDNELRALAAEAVHRHVASASSPGVPGQRVFQAVERFLRELWPQELSLRSPGISNAFAQIPSEMPEKFAIAVEAIRRFLVPFDCWSMYEYGLGGDRDGRPRLAMIDNQEKAQALLSLLHSTVGDEGSVVPDELTDALDQIRAVWRLADKQAAFRRLSALARR